jgi:hypothetical protein
MIGPTCPGNPDKYWDSRDLMKLIFPLPVDQRLFVLAHHNALRAIVTNITILSLEHLLVGECTGVQHGGMQLFAAPETVPESLMPTTLQRTVPHESWIDLIPSPRMRDNTIMLSGTFDECDLCADLVGGIHAGSSNDYVENNGMLAWSDPWHVRGV